MNLDNAYRINCLHKDNGFVVKMGMLLLTFPLPNPRITYAKLRLNSNFAAPQQVQAVVGGGGGSVYCECQREQKEDEAWGHGDMCLVLAWVYIKKYSSLKRVINLRNLGFSSVNKICNIVIIY